MSQKNFSFFYFLALDWAKPSLQERFFATDYFWKFLFILGRFRRRYPSMYTCPSILASVLNLLFYVSNYLIVELRSFYLCPEKNNLLFLFLGCNRDPTNISDVSFSCPFFLPSFPYAARVLISKKGANGSTIESRSLKFYKISLLLIL